MSERIQKLLAAAGHGSRRGIEEWIRAGRVTLNGRAASLGDRASPEDRICLDGKPLDLVSRAANTAVLLYHKPVGEVTTRSDPQGRPTVFERLPPLATLDNLISSAMSFGFVFITLGVIAGSAWAFIESGTRWIADPKVGISLVTWLCYLVMVFLRVSAGWRGRRAAVLALAVLGCSAATWAAHVGLRSHLIR